MYGVSMYTWKNSCTHVFYMRTCGACMHVYYMHTCAHAATDTATTAAAAVCRCDCHEHDYIMTCHTFDMWVVSTSDILCMGYT